MQKPNKKAWQVYYMWQDLGKYRPVADYYGCTSERIRQIVRKVVKYLENGNTRIMSREEAFKKEVFELETPKIYGGQKYVMDIE